MPFVKAQCMNCGASLEVDNSKDAAICPACGTPYVVEKAIQQFNINSVSAIHTDVLNIVDESAQREIEAAEAYLRLKDYQTAETKFKSLTETLPQEARTWYGLVRALTKDGSVQLPSASTFAFIKHAYHNATTFNPDINKQIPVTDWFVYFKTTEHNIQCEAERYKTQYKKLQGEIDKIRHQRRKATIICILGNIGLFIMLEVIAQLCSGITSRTVAALFALYLIMLPGWIIYYLMHSMDRVHYIQHEQQETRKLCCKYWGYNLTQEEFEELIYDQPAAE